MNFSFDEPTHSYIVEGRSVPSCTRILDHAGLVSYDMVRQDILERKSTIGTLVHLATHYYDDGNLDLDSLDSYTKGRTEAWVAFRKDTGFVPRQDRIEQPFIATINGMTYGLRIDREGFFGTGVKKTEAIIEIKTSSTRLPWWGIQLAGYALGVPDYEKKISSQRALFARRRRMAVQLFEDGTYKKHDFADLRDADVFISGLHITHWKLGIGESLREVRE